jgi:membrane protein implicated in regulation of membrane protease activity
MRRLWLLLAFTLLVLIDLSILPTIVLWIFVGSILTTHGAPFLTSVLLAAALGAGLLWLTFVVGRAWRRSPRPQATQPSN